MYGTYTHIPHVWHTDTSLMCGTHRHAPHVWDTDTHPHVWDTDTPLMVELTCWWSHAQHVKPRPTGGANLTDGGAIPNRWS